MYNDLLIDDVAYPLIHVEELKRSFSVLDGKNTTRVLTGDMRRDIIGTYYNYSMSLVADAEEGSMAQYDAVYEVLSSPDECHTIKVPYAQGYKVFRAYVTSGEDNMVYRELGADGPTRTKWEGLSVNFIAMSPERTPA